MLPCLCSFHFTSLTFILCLSSLHVHVASIKHTAGLNNQLLLTSTLLSFVCTPFLLRRCLKSPLFSNFFLLTCSGHLLQVYLSTYFLCALLARWFPFTTLLLLSVYSGSVLFMLLPRREHHHPPREGGEKESNIAVIYSLPQMFAPFSSSTSNLR